MAKIAQKRVQWAPVNGAPDIVNYRLYISQDAPVSYDSDYLETTPDNTSFILPDEIPFEMTEGLFYFGVSSLDSAGNESDITITGAVSLDFIPPEAPASIEIIPLQ